MTPGIPSGLYTAQILCQVSYMSCQKPDADDPGFRASGWPWDSILSVQQDGSSPPHGYPLTDPVPGMIHPEANSQRTVSFHSTVSFHNFTSCHSLRSVALSAADVQAVSVTGSADAVRDAVGSCTSTRWCGADNSKVNRTQRKRPPNVAQREIRTYYLRKVSVPSSEITGGTRTWAARNVYTSPPVHIRYAVRKSVTNSSSADARRGIYPTA